MVDAKPTTTTTTVVDNGTFKTKTEAETGMKTMKVCTEHMRSQTLDGSQGPALASIDSFAFPCQCSRLAGSLFLLGQFETPRGAK